MNKFYSKTAVKFGLEVAGTEEILTRKAGSPAKLGTKGRFYDAITGKTQTTIQSSGMTDGERAYLSLSKVIDTNNTSFSINSNDNSITFNNTTIATPPVNFPALGVQDFQVFINGLIVEPSAITSIEQVGADTVVNFGTGLEYTITNQMEVTIVGKLEE